MKQELTGKNEIMEKQKVLLEKLKGAKTLKDYLVIWREAEK
jgi:hypothetical protein